MNSLFVAFRSGSARNWGPVARLDRIDGAYRFVYTQGAKTLAGFQPFAEMPDLDRSYESDELFPLFANRLLSSSRPEYEDFLRWSGFEGLDPPDPIGVLSLTEGIRQTDAVEVFPCPVPAASGCYLNKFFVHGLRRMDRSAVERVSRLEPGEKLYLMRDDQNEFDSHAVAVRTGDPYSLVGYVPRYFARDVRRLWNDCGTVELHVDRVNRDATLQYRLLCRVESCRPSFEPCSDPEYQPIPKIERIVR